jgi:thioredoxin-dependent peroxiredoxin
MILSWLWSAPLPPGVSAPDFALPDESGRIVRLSELRGRNVVLVFYPGDDTSLCTKQLCAFRDDWKIAQDLGVVIFGINPQSAKKHLDFRAKFNFPFPLLVDRGQKIGALYHAHGLIVKRTVYLIDPVGIIRFGQRGVPPVSEVWKHSISQ